MRPIQYPVRLTVEEQENYGPSSPKANRRPGPFDEPRSCLLRMKTGQAVA